MDNVSTIAGLTFIAGVGKAKNHTACLMSAARILSGEATEADVRADSCARVCRVVRRFAIGVNDWRGWTSDAERTEHLMRIAPMLLDTVGDRDLQQRRAFALADIAVRVIAPIGLDARADCLEQRCNVGRAARLRTIAVSLRGIDEIVDRAGAERARYAADAASYAAAAADAAASDAAAADAASYAASYAAAAADAASYAADDAAAASYAADDADAASYADLREQRRVAIRDALVACLVRICEMR